MLPTFRAAGNLYGEPLETTLAIVGPASKANDILLAFINAKSNQAVTPPAGWTGFVDYSNTSAMRVFVFWKRAVAADSGATFLFTKPAADNIVFGGFIAAYYGAISFGNPIGRSTITTKANASGDTLSYDTFTPEETEALVLAAGFYNENLTNAGEISGANPTFTNRADRESATGTDFSIFLYDGRSDGNATGARSHLTSSAADAISVGVLFELVLGADVIWDFDLLRPRDFEPAVAAATRSGGQASEGGEQIEMTDAGFWEFTYLNIPVVSTDQNLAWSEYEARLLGRSRTVLITLADSKRAPWASGDVGGTITAFALGDFAQGATEGSLVISVGGTPRAGMHFSAGERAYRLTKVENTHDSPGTYDVEIWPPVREKIAGGDPLEFRRPVCRCRLMADDEMRLTRVRLAHGYPSVRFYEDV